MDTTLAFPLESDEERLHAFGLSTEIFHDALRAATSRAASRSALALKSSAGRDIYDDGMEGLHQLLQPHGWKLLPVNRQPRLVHPEGTLSFAISSAINVGKARGLVPRTRKKGPATRGSLVAMPDLTPSLFADLDAEVAARLEAAERAPLYFLLCERITVGGNGLSLEFSQPAGMTEGGIVNTWRDRIEVRDLMLEGDLSVFDQPDEPDEFDVPVEPR
jgi:hypothetical protein